MNKEVDAVSKARWAFSLCTVAYGMAFNGFIYGYTSPALPGLLRTNLTSHHDTNELTLTEVEASWVSSLTSLGAPVGGLLCGLLTEVMGKKKTALLGQTLSYVTGHLLLMVAPSVGYLYAGRFICGICQGFCNCLTILYTLWICQGKSARTKSMAGVSLCIIGNAGTLLTYGLGVLCNWRQLAGVLACLAFPYTIGLLFVVPDDNELENNLISEESSGEMTKNLILKLSEEGTMNNNNTLGEKGAMMSDDCTIYHQLRTPEIARKPVPVMFQGLMMTIKDALCCGPLWVGLLMMLFYQFGGYNVITFYASTIIASTARVSDGHEKAVVASVAVAFSGLVGVALGLVLVRLEINRKAILMVSGLGTSAAFTALCLSFHVDSLGHFDELGSVWASTIALTMHILLFNLGYGALVFPIIAEILPYQNRSKYMAVITTFGGLFGFANAKSFVDLQLAFGPIATFATYAVVNVFGTIFFALFVPQLP